MNKTVPNRFTVLLGAIALAPTALLGADVTSNIAAPQQPDLSIERVAVDGSCRVVVAVTNRGPGRVPESVWTAKSRSSSSVKLSVDGISWGAEPIWRFDPSRRLQGPGGRTTVTLGYVVKVTVSVNVTVDHTAQVTETDERNNAATTTLTCEAPTAARPSDGPPPVPGDRLRPLGEEPDTQGRSPQPGSPADTGAPPVAATPPAGSSLLDAPLPPPPQNLASPAQRDARVEPAEVVIASGSMAEALALAQSAQGLGFGIRRRTNLQGLGMVMTVLRLPRDMSVGNALATLRQALPSLWADANHRFALQGDGALNYGRALIGWNASAYCGRGVRVGMLDTVLDRTHPTLKGRDIATRSLLPAGIPRAPPDHGTAVAALLVGNSQSSGFGGLVPAAKLYAAEIFRARDKNQVDTTAEWVVAALDWLATQQVDIVNLSLGGPRNLIVEVAITRLLERRIAVVAAGGNSGPEAPPVYPAAQPGVVAVTAVDVELKPYKRASRGSYIAFAAPGVDVWSAVPGKQGGYHSGTSYAAPFVTAVFVARRQAQPKTAWSKLIQQTQAQARDLGVQGKDSVYGWGLLQAGGCGATGADRR